MLSILYNFMSSQDACRFELEVPMQMKCVFLPLAMLMQFLYKHLEFMSNA
jgi:hypothetical protein